MLQTMEIGRYLRALSFVGYGDKDIEILKVMRKGIIEPIFIDAVTHAEYARRMDLMGSDIIYKARARTLFTEESA